MNGLTLLQALPLVAGVWLIVVVLNSSGSAGFPVRIELPLAAMMFALAIIAGR